MSPENGNGADAPKVERRRYRMEPKLREFFGSLALIAAAAGDSYGAQVISLRTDDLAHSWAKLAEANPTIRRLLEALTSGGAYGEAIMVTGSVVIPILWRHGVVPDELGYPVAVTAAPEPTEELLASIRAKAAAEGRPVAPEEAPAKAEEPSPETHPMGPPASEPQGSEVPEEVHPMGAPGGSSGGSDS